MYKVYVSRRGEKELVFVGEKEEAARFEDQKRKELRKTDPEGIEIDVYMVSDAEETKTEEAKARWDMLTDEQKEDIIEIDGRKYIRAIYEGKQ